MSGQQITREDIENRFEFHPATPARGQTHTNVRRVIKSAALSLVSNLPPSRELSLAITKLEEAMFWANASVARQGNPELVETEADVEDNA